jgi:hypothetical protein
MKGIITLSKIKEVIIMTETIIIKEPMGLPKMKLELNRSRDRYTVSIYGTLYVQPCKGVWDQYRFVYNTSTDIIPILKDRSYDQGTIRLIKNMVDHYESIISEAERSEL